MDAVDPELVDAAEASLRSVPGVRGVEELRLRWIGHRIRAETGLAVDPDLTLSEAHGIAHEAQHRLLHDVPKPADAIVHVSPSNVDGRAAHDSVAHHGIHAGGG
jgi:divalent metal cation (Fe/Co/Zn/Cd) transporter